MLVRGKFFREVFEVEVYDGEDVGDVCVEESLFTVQGEYSPLVR
jgi:hypothetical protein